MKKSFVQHFIAIGIFIVIACVYCWPALQGNKFSAGDTTHWMGMSHEAKVWSEKTGENPLWSNSMFGGMPTATYATNGHDNLIWEIQLFIMDHIPNPIYVFIIAMICFYIFAVSWKLDRIVGIIGAIAYAFASYNIQITVAGHATKMFSIAFMPLILAGMHWIYSKKYLLGAGVTLFGMSLMMSNAMYQIVYYFIFIVAVFGIGYLLKSLKDNSIKDFIIASCIMIGAVAISVGPSLSTFMFTKEYSKATMRGGQSEITIGKKDKKENGGLNKDYAFQWSQSIGETFTLLVPNLYGGGNRTNVGTSSNTFEAVSKIAGDDQAEQFSKNASTYWGPQPFLSGPVYFGAIIMFLFVLSLFVIKNNFKWLLVGVGFFGIMLSWGKHFSAFNYFLFDHLPMYNNFRTPSMAMAIPGLAFCVLAIWALNEYFKESNISTESMLDSIKKSFLITGGLCLVLGIGSSLFMSFKGDNDDKLKSQMIQMTGNNEQAGTAIFNALVEDRPAIAMKDGIRSFIFILLAAIVLWFFAKKKLSATMALASVGLLIAIDLLGIGTRYISEDNYIPTEQYESQFTPRPVDLQILQDKDPYYRVFDLTTDPYNDAMGAYHHKMVGGYHPAKMETYQDLIDNHLSSGKMNAQVLNMLNTKYLIFNGQNNQPSIQQNKDACGNAWFVRNIKLVKNADEEMTSLNAENIGDTAKVENPFRAKQSAIVQEKLWKGNSNLVFDSLANIRLIKYGLNDLAFESNNSQDGFAVFADVYYNKGWKAYIDGKETEIIKTNYLLRGLNIPAGKHKITFEFKPQTYLKWGSVSLATSILILLLFVAGIGMSVKKK